MNSNKFMQRPADKKKWINYTMNLKSYKIEEKEIKNEEKTFEKERNSIYLVKTMRDILYGNPKVSKRAVYYTPRFRRILSAINTPTYLLAKYPKLILSRLINYCEKF